MGKSQSKPETVVNNNNIQEQITMPIIPESVATAAVIITILYAAYKINKYFKNYVHKHKNQITNV